MANYRTPAEIQEMIEAATIINCERTKIYQKYSIDLLDNDTMSSLFVWDIVTKYDFDYNTNFSRNGEDAVSNNVIIEQKCANVKPTRTGNIGKAAFQFHAMGDLVYPRYIFTVRNKETLEPVRIYDISDPANVEVITGHLISQSNAWLEKGKENPAKNMKRDVITLPETLILDQITVNLYKVINNCQVFKD